MLQVLLLGAFDVRRDGQSVCTVWRRHADRLLALLVLNHNRTLSDDWVVTALGIPESALPHAISELYKVLGEERNRVRHAGDQLYFDAAGIDVDAFRFDKLVAKGDRNALECAVALYRGGILKGWEEAGWLCEERESYFVAYLDALDTLAGLAAAEGRFDRAASFLRRYVDIYPEMDAAWARLVEILAQAGETAAVAQTQERYLLEVRHRVGDGHCSTPSQRVLTACARALGQPDPTAGAPEQAAPDSRLTRADHVAAYLAEPIGGAVPLDSPFYVERPADALAHAALQRSDSFILVKGARQVGKSSLLARLTRAGHEHGARVVRTDFHKAPRETLETSAALLADVAETFAEHLDLAIPVRSHFEVRRTPTRCFESFLRNGVFPALDRPLVWVVDGADRLFECDFRDDVFAMLRSWHNERANDVHGKWSLLTVVLAYATEPYLFIANQDQSPFNLGTRIDLDDFTLAQVRELNRLYGAPLSADGELDRLYDLVGGHPYLARRCLQDMALSGCSFDRLESATADGEGPCKDHLQRLLLAIRRDPRTLATVKAMVAGGNLDSERFLSLRAAGVARGASAADARFRCKLYEIFLTQALK
jgi:DNA-binding SARP family transcriptional activator